MKLSFRACAIAIVAPIAAFAGALSGGLPTAAATCPPPTSDVYAQAVLADAPAAYYRLDESSGQALCDASGHSVNGTYSGTGITYGQPGALHPTTDPAIAASGSVNPATSTGNSGIAGSTDFTLEGWFQTTTKQDQVVVSIGQSGTQNMAGVGPWSNASGPTGGTGDLITFDTFGGSFKFDVSGLGINVFDGAWHYTVLTFAAGTGTATAYLDGHNLGTATVADHPVASPVRVGYWIDTVFNQPFAGGLDEVAVYPSALTNARVSAHYAAALQAAATSPSPTTLPTLPHTGKVPTDPAAGSVAAVLFVLMAAVGVLAATRALRAPGRKNS